MNLRRVAALGLVALALAAGGCKKTSVPAESTLDLNEPTEAQPRLQTIQLWLGAAQLTAEMALTPKQEQTGMMFRTSLPENQGMIFVLPLGRASFWMKNCPLPLSVAYIDPDGVIQEIHHLEPYNTNSVLSASENIAYALETNQGWFKRHHVRPGMTVRTERGSLRDTFHPGQ